MAREELKWENINADDLPTDVKQSFDAMVEAEAAFKTDLEKLLKKGRPHARGQARTHKPKEQPEIGGEGGAGSLKFKTK